ncbi:hypothetical protein D5086_021454 [Populus alba]|uniref:Uncharacterized protein n=1 Tax=Populus alba TaxID=43335 RepID=A0ACC4BD24_POPAL
MMLNPLVSSPSLYDIASTPGVAADVSHINSRTDQVLSGCRVWWSRTTSGSNRGIGYCDYSCRCSKKTRNDS